VSCRGRGTAAQEVGRPAFALTFPPTPPAPDMAKLTAIAAKYRIEILGPLPD
jgi:hypothetical protein